MADAPHAPPDAAALIAAARRMDARGWVPATSGNLSLRAPGGAWITPSGVDKGALGEADLLRVDASGQAAAGRPSAETLLHLMIYRRFPGANAVLHAHSASAVVLSRALGRDVVLSGFELQKALDGETDHAATVRIPVIDNAQDMARLVPEVAAALDRTQSRWAFVLAGHGVYAWGRDVAAAFRHLEALDALFTCLLMERSWQPR